MKYQKLRRYSKAKRGGVCLHPDYVVIFGNKVSLYINKKNNRILFTPGIIPNNKEHFILHEEKIIRKVPK